MSSFYRRLRLKELFYKPNSVGDDQHIPKFRLKSGWQPPKNRNPSLETFIACIANDVTNHSPRDYADHIDNISKGERKAIPSLSQRDDIVIRRADKGSGVVVMDISAYIAEADKQLSNQRLYRKLDHDPTCDHVTLVTEAINYMLHTGDIDSDTAQYLLPRDAKEGRFYLLPKVHKPGIPGRPFISANNHPTEKFR